MTSDDTRSPSDFQAGPHDDPRFVRDGMRLSFWLLAMVSGDLERQAAAAQRVSDMELGVQGDAGDDAVAAWAVAWRATLNAALRDPVLGGLPMIRLLFSEALVVERARIADIRRRFNLGGQETDPQAERLAAALKRAVARPPGDAEEQQRRAQRLWQVVCAGFTSLLPSDEENMRELQQMGLTLGFISVLRSLDADLLAHPDLVLEWLHEKHLRWTLYEVLIRLGPEARAFAPALEELIASGEEHVGNAAGALAALLAGDAAAVARYVAAWAEAEAEEPCGRAAVVLSRLGAREVATAERFPAAIRSGLQSPLAWRRASAAWLATLLPDAEDTQIKRLVELSSDADVWVASAAITTLGELGRNAEVVVPALVAALTSFEEPDPDERGGRVIKALAGFPVVVVAELAAPALATLVWRAEQDPWVDEDACAALIRMGTAAHGALPTVEAACSAARAEQLRIQALNRAAIAQHGKRRARTLDYSDPQSIARAVAALSGVPYVEPEWGNEDEEEDAEEEEDIDDT